MTTVLSSPYRNESLNRIYDLLFCDNPDLFRPDTKELEPPFSILFAEPANATDLQELQADESAEARIRILAAVKLHELGLATNTPLLGVIIEVGLESGLDVVAAYQDGTARYINQAEKILIWDSRTIESDRLIQELMNVSEAVVSKIGPWDGERLAPPKNGEVRLTFLKSGQLYFGQGPMSALSSDAMGGPVINAALELMIFLTAH